MPDAIKGDADAQAFFDLLSGIHLHSGGGPIERSELAGMAQEVVELVGSRVIVGIWSNESAQDEIRNAIDDYLCDTLRDARRIDLSGELIEKIEAEIMRLARARFHA